MYFEIWNDSLTHQGFREFFSRHPGPRPYSQPGTGCFSEPRPAPPCTRPQLSLELTACAAPLSGEAQHGEHRRVQKCSGSGRNYGKDEQCWGQVGKTPLLGHNLALSLGDFQTWHSAKALSVLFLTQADGSATAPRLQVLSIFIFLFASSWAPTFYWKALASVSFSPS